MSHEPTDRAADAETANPYLALIERRAVRATSESAALAEIAMVEPLGLGATEHLFERLPLVTPAVLERVFERGGRLSDGRGALGVALARNEALGEAEAGALAEFFATHDREAGSFRGFGSGFLPVFAVLVRQGRLGRNSALVTRVWERVMGADDEDYEGGRLLEALVHAPWLGGDDLRQLFERVRRGVGSFARTDLLRHPAIPPDLAIEVVLHRGGRMGGRDDDRVVQALAENPVIAGWGSAWTVALLERAPEYYRAQWLNALAGTLAPERVPDGTTCERLLVSSAPEHLWTVARELTPQLAARVPTGLWAPLLADGTRPREWRLELLRRLGRSATEDAPAVAVHRAGGGVRR